MTLLSPFPLLQSKHCFRPAQPAILPFPLPEADRHTASGRFRRMRRTRGSAMPGVHSPTKKSGGRRVSQCPGGRARADMVPDRSFAGGYRKRFRDQHSLFYVSPQSSTKRRLFAAEECEGCDVAPPCTSAPETFFGRQDSSTSALTCLDSAPSEEAGPSTPEQVAAGRRSPVATDLHALEATLLYALQVGCPVICCCPLVIHLFRCCARRFHHLHCDLLPCVEGEELGSSSWQL